MIEPRKEWEIRNNSKEKISIEHKIMIHCLVWGEGRMVRNAKNLVEKCFSNE